MCLTYKAVRFDSMTGLPSIVDIEFKIEGEWLYITKGCVTGYESARIGELIKNDYVFDVWVACSGTQRQYDRLIVPIVEIKRFLKGVN